MSKMFLSLAVLVGYVFLQTVAGYSHYYNRPMIQPKPQETGYYLPNYDVPTPQDYHGNVYSPEWQPIVHYPWPEQHREGPYFPPHYHAGPKAPCPYSSTTTHRPTTTSTTTTTTKRTTTTAATTTTTTTPKPHHQKATLASLLHHKY